ncbi:Mediator of RNA polymerase II transcription subunit 22 [Xenoophorus captivus]|uniref:Mediator of RNA polymerase II transcription subunit 22 n=1 Tax=Xenoophorus captivus TaxID=1517983 RepID=A0ABV0QSP2_9TELE
MCIANSYKKKTRSNRPVLDVQPNNSSYENALKQYLLWVLLSTMANQRVLPQSKETLLQNYNKRLKDDIKSIMDNFTEIVKTAKVEDETQVSRPTQAEQDHYEMHVRAANIVSEAQSVMLLVL